MPVLELHDCPDTYRGLCSFCFDQLGQEVVQKRVPRNLEEEGPEYVAEIDPWHIRHKYKWWDRTIRYYENRLSRWVAWHNAKSRHEAERKRAYKEELARDKHGAKDDQEGVGGQVRP
jgi:hypothetical protein